jgi:nitrate reductase NapE component
MSDIVAKPRKWLEALVFLIVAGVISPIMISALVGAYGFSFWVYFMLYGPPGAQ